jgi:zinc protease
MDGVLISLEDTAFVDEFLETFYAGIEHTPNGPIMIALPRLLTGGETRFTKPSSDEVSARTLKEMRAWLAPQLATGPIEIAIVGDIDTEATIAAVAATFGTLRPRTDKLPFEAGRRVSFVAPFAQTLTFDSTIPRGELVFVWPTTDAVEDIAPSRSLDVLAAIILERLRIKIREQLGDTYVPHATNFSNDTCRGFGYMHVQVTIDPAKAALLEQTITDIAADLVKSGVSDDELDRAKNPILASIRESARTNLYWIRSVLGTAQEYPRRLDWCRTRLGATESITKEDIAACAKKYLAPERAFRVTIIPAQTGQL